MTLLLVYLFIAVGISFLCSILEAVLLSVPQSFVEQSIATKKRGADTLKQAKGDIDQSLSSILILNTFAHTMGAAGVGVQAVKVFGQEKETLIAFLLTLIILYFSEIIPKTLGAKYWRALAIPVAVMTRFLIKVTYPLVWIASLLTRLFNKDTDDVISREELLATAHLSHKGGAIVEQESVLMKNIFKLKHVKVRDILTPRVVVHALDQDMTISEALSAEKTKYFTRIPVYLGTIDNITGVILKAKLYEQERQGGGDAPLASVADEISRVSENLPVLNLLDTFIKRQAHIFLVEDKFGQTAGVVTLEDAVETFLGREIVDESDSVVDMQKLAKARFRKRLKEKENQVIFNDDDSYES